MSDSPLTIRVLRSVRLPLGDNGELVYFYTGRQYALPYWQAFQLVRNGWAECIDPPGEQEQICPSYLPRARAKATQKRQQPPTVFTESSPNAN